MQKLLFPMQFVNITQGSYGSFSHKNLKAIDNAGRDSGADIVFSSGHGKFTYVERKYNAYSSVSYKNVISPLGEEYKEVNILHYHQTALPLFKVGDKLRPYEHFSYEGKNFEPGGGATGNHQHFETRIWIDGNRTNIVPEQLFFLKRGFHIFVKNTSKYKFYWLSDERNVLKNQIKVNFDRYNIRTSTEIADNIIGYAEPGYYDVLEIKKDNGYTWYKIYDNMWIALTSSITFIKKMEMKDYKELFEFEQDEEEVRLIFEGGRKGVKIYYSEK